MRIWLLCVRRYYLHVFRVYVFSTPFESSVKPRLVDADRFDIDVGGVSASLKQH